MRFMLMNSGRNERRTFSQYVPPIIYFINKAWKMDRTNANPGGIFRPRDQRRSNSKHLARRAPRTYHCTTNFRSLAWADRVCDAYVGGIRPWVPELFTTEETGLASAPATCRSPSEKTLFSGYLFSGYLGSIQQVCYRRRVGCR